MGCIRALLFRQIRMVSICFTLEENMILIFLSRKFGNELINIQ
jgi:hypothetical protein